MRNPNTNIVRVKLIRSGAVAPVNYFELANANKKAPPQLSRMAAVLARRAEFKRA